MKDMLDVIRDELKDVHIEDGTKGAFERVCAQLNDRLSVNAVYALGFKNGEEAFMEKFKELLDIKDCDCSNQ